MKKISKDRLIFMIMAYTLTALLAMICLLPMVLIVSGSFTSQEYIMKHGYSLLPKDFNLDAYKLLFLNPIVILRSYFITISSTVTGTLIGLGITAMTAYVLGRTDFEWRNKFSLFFYFTMLFNGGIVPWYILCMKYLKLNDNFLGLVLPIMLNVFNIIIMKTFMAGIPNAITESAKIDGAGDFTIFRKLILPLSKPVLATVGLFIALSYWNDWFLSFMFMQDDRFFTLQFSLYRVLSVSQALQKIASSFSAAEQIKAPTETIKLAMTVVSTGPIILLYPFLQKYFIRGLTIGAVKG